MKSALRFSGPALLTNSAATKYTVASGQAIVIRHIHVDNPAGGSNATLFISIGSDAAGARIFAGENVAPGVPLDHWCYYPLAAGEIIQAYSGTNNVLTCTISGDLITLG